MVFESKTKYENDCARRNEQARKNCMEARSELCYSRDIETVGTAQNIDSTSQ